MYGSIGQHISRALAAAAPRRETARALFVPGLMAVAGRLGYGEAEARKNKRKKKRRCRKRTKACGGKKTCCNKGGLVRCDIVSEPLECANLGKNVCCGLDGAPCNPALSGCDCCGELFCVQYETESLCRSEAT